VEAGVILRIVAASIALLWSATAGAQPSFNCAKASSVVERAICADPKLASADRELAKVYGALWEKVTGAAREHLAKDQVRWLANRGKACNGAADDVARCVRLRYASRLATLKAESTDAYPFVGEHALVRGGKVENTRYEVDASYPQFEMPRMDFSAVNKVFAEVAQKGAKDAVPGPGDGRPGVDMVWTYYQGFELHRPSPNAVSVATTFYIFTGGAHGSSGLTAILVDLRSGREVLPVNVFTADSDWRHRIADFALADLKKQFVERPGFSEALEPNNFEKLMDEPGRYLFKADGLEIIFNPYDVGPYAAGRYTVGIPYSRLSGLIRTDGPLGR
jgi:uncharacterized protein